jgi:hypothetical protein
VKRKLINVVVAAVVAVSTHSTFAGEKVDVSTVITKAEAEKILGVPVKDPKGRNKEGTDGFYESDWSYSSVKGDKGLVLDLLVAGRGAPPNLTKTMFSVLPPNGGKSTNVGELGEKAIFYHDKSGLDILNILKGDMFITIGIHGLPATAALEQEKAAATKILAHL